MSQNLYRALYQTRTGTVRSTLKLLKTLLHYDPLTGQFTRLVDAGGRRAGTIAGGPHKAGYWDIRIKEKHYLAHRLAWLYMTGKWPKEEIDHINGDRGDTRFANLREASSTQNKINSAVRCDNAQGVRGIWYRKDTGKWSGQCTVNKKRFHIGCFDSKEEAAAVYKQFALRLHGEFIKGVKP